MTNQQPARQTPWGRSRAILDILTSLVLLAASGAVVWASLQFRKPGPSSAPARSAAATVAPETVTLTGRPILGVHDAALTMIEVADFECPYCGRFARDVLPVLRQEYVDRGLLRISFSHLPLSIHALAMPAAQLAECAHSRGKFWDFYDAVFLVQEKARLDAAALESAAARVGVSSGGLGACQGPADQAIAQDQAFAKKLVINSTPAFLLGQTQKDGTAVLQTIIWGAKPAEDFRAELDKALRAAGK